VERIIAKVSICIAAEAASVRSLGDGGLAVTAAILEHER
jgi:hypothetical protein